MWSGACRTATHRTPGLVIRTREPGPVHDGGRDLGPLLVGQHPVSGRGPDRAVPHGLLLPAERSSAKGRRSNPASRRKSGAPSARRSGSSSAGSPNPATRCGSVCSFARPARTNTAAVLRRLIREPLSRSSGMPTHDRQKLARLTRSQSSTGSPHSFQLLRQPVQVGSGHPAPTCVTAPGHAAANRASSFHHATLDRAGPELSIGYVYLARLIRGFHQMQGLASHGWPPETQDPREDHMGMINSIRCHSLPQIAALLYRKRRVVRLARRGHESGGLRTERGGEPGQVRPRHTGRAWRSN